jgi:hypothetical protein
MRTLGVLALVHLADILPLLVVDDGQDTGNGLANGVAGGSEREEHGQRNVRTTLLSETRSLSVPTEIQVMSRPPVHGGTNQTASGLHSRDIRCHVPVQLVLSREPFERTA